MKKTIDKILDVLIIILLFILLPFALYGVLYTLFLIYIVPHAVSDIIIFCGQMLSSLFIILMIIREIRIRRHYRNR